MVCEAVELPMACVIRCDYTGYDIMVSIRMIIKFIEPNRVLFLFTQPHHYEILFKLSHEHTCTKSQSIHTAYTQTHTDRSMPAATTTKKYHEILAHVCVGRNTIACSTDRHTHTERRMSCIRCVHIRPILRNARLFFFSSILFFCFKHDIFWLVDDLPPKNRLRLPQNR